MVVFLIDADNLSAPIWIEDAFRALESTEGDISIRRAYGSAENLKGLAEVLRVWAIRPFINLYLSKNTTDIALAVDAMELACQTPRPKTIVIGSGDADFVPLVVRLRERGIRLICVSEQSKMATEAVSAYHQVVLVGKKKATHMAQLAVEETQIPIPILSASSVKKAVPKKAPTTKAAVKNVPTKKAAAKKTAEKNGADPLGKITVQHILDVVPALKTGQLQPLGDVAKLLHDAKLLGKNSASPKLFKKFPHHFELSPLKQPNQVRYIPTPQ
jgi:uncharacterized LabA/DUF88 family protein